MISRPSLDFAAEESRWPDPVKMISRWPSGSPSSSSTLFRSRWGRCGSAVRRMNRSQPPVYCSPAALPRYGFRAGLGWADLGPDHGDLIEGTLAIASQDHGAQGQQIMSLAVAKDGLLETCADGDRKDREQEERQDAALTIVTTTCPMVEPAGEPDRQQDEIECQVQTQGRGGIGPSVHQVIERPLQILAGPPGHRHGRRRGKQDQAANRHAAVDQVGHCHRGQQIERYEQEEIQPAAWSARPERRCQGRHGQPDHPKRSTRRFGRVRSHRSGPGGWLARRHRFPAARSQVPARTV